MSAQRLELLRRATITLGASHNLKEVIGSILCEAQVLLSAASWAVWLREADDDTITCWLAEGPAGDVLRGYRVQLGQGIVGRAVREGVIVHVNDLRNEPRADDLLRERAEARAVTLLCCPLNVRADTETATLGALSVTSPIPDAFDAQDVAMVSVLAASAATAIQDARLHASLQRELDERRRVEDALRESEAHYRALVETSPNLTLLLNQQGEILVCNQRTLDRLGYANASELLGLSYLDLVPDEIRPEAQQAFQLLLKGGSLRDDETMMMRRDGTPVPIEFSAHRIIDSAGNPSGVVAFARDISLRREAESSVRRLALRLQVLNDLADRISHSYDQHHLLESGLDVALGAVNSQDGWAALFGTHVCDLCDAEVEARRGLFRARHLAVDLREAARAIASDACSSLARVSVEVAPPPANPREHASTSSLIAVPLVLQARPIGVLVVTMVTGEAAEPDPHLADLLSDISDQLSVAIDRARLAQQAADAQMLRKLDGMRSELIASFSHDLRTPLGIILMTCSTLLRDDVDFDQQTQREFLQDIVGQVDRLTRLVDGILDLGRLESGRLGLDRVPLDLRSLLRQLYESMELGGRPHRLKLELPEAPLVVLADPLRLDQVLGNLMENALKYSPGGGQVTIRGSRQAGEVLVSISDTGIGIPHEQLDLIFERFYRVRSPETKHIGGSGLGLTTCKGIIEAHGGSIWATSRVGEGSTFTFSLPFYEEPPVTS